MRISCYGCDFLSKEQTTQGRFVIQQCVKHNVSIDQFRAKVGCGIGEPEQTEEEMYEEIVIRETLKMRLKMDGSG